MLRALAQNDSNQSATGRDPNSAIGKTTPNTGALKAQSKRSASKKPRLAFYHLSNAFIVFRGERMLT